MVANFSPTTLGRLDINRFCLSITILDDSRTNYQKESRYFTLRLKLSELKIQIRAIQILISVIHSIR